MNFADLTWEDLKEWAGDRVVGRGKSYKRQVEDLRVTADGALLAWVLGGDRYATRVRMDAGDDLSSQCACPYGESCKHAVATILAYLDAEWKNYLAELREQNARRPRMLDVLNSLEGRRTSIVQSAN